MDYGSSVVVRAFGLPVAWEWPSVLAQGVSSAMGHFAGMGRSCWGGRIRAARGGQLGGWSFCLGRYVEVAGGRGIVADLQAIDFCEVRLEFDLV